MAERFVKCRNCGTGNPEGQNFCGNCGATIVQPVERPSRQTVPTRQYLASQTQTTISKMLDTPGTMILTIGLLLLLISVIAFAAGAWGPGIGLFFISMILIYVALQLRRHEAAVASANAAANLRYAPRVIEKHELREREIVKVKCRHCGSLNPDGARNCGSCGAPL